MISYQETKAKPRFDYVENYRHVQNAPRSYEQDR